VLLKRLAPFLLAFVLPLLIVFVWIGGFNGVDLSQATRGPYTYAYLERSGDYAKLPDIQLEARQALDQQGIKHGLGIVVLYSNPDVVAQGERRARAGYLVAPGSAVAEPLKLDTLAARPVLLARVQASARLAPSKAYSALDSYQQARGRGIVMPTVEIYQPADTPYVMGVLSVEMPLAEAAPR
jgi:hypothetical protein